MGIEEGMNGTIQVVSSGDGEGGGLYNVCIRLSICFQCQEQHLESHSLTC